MCTVQVNGDRRADAITIADNGVVGVKLNAGGDGHGGWSDLGQVASGVTADRTRIRWADVDGDGRADYNVINTNGSISTYINRGGEAVSPWIVRPTVSAGHTTTHGPGGLEPRLLAIGTLSDRGQGHQAGLSGGRVRPSYPPGRAVVRAQVRPCPRA